MSFMNQLGFQWVYLKLKMEENIISTTGMMLYLYLRMGVTYNKLSITTGMTSKSNLKRKSSTYICVIRSRCRMESFYFFCFLGVTVSKICKTTYTSGK